MREFEKELNEQWEIIKEKMMQSVKDKDPEYLDYGHLKEDFEVMTNIYSQQFEEVDSQNMKISYFNIGKQHLFGRNKKLTGILQPNQ